MGIIKTHKKCGPATEQWTTAVLSVPRERVRTALGS